MSFNSGHFLQANLLFYFWFFSFCVLLINMAIMLFRCIQEDKWTHWLRRTISLWICILHVLLFSSVLFSGNYYVCADCTLCSWWWKTIDSSVTVYKLICVLYFRDFGWLEKMYWMNFSWTNCFLIVTHSTQWIG